MRTLLILAVACASLDAGRGVLSSTQAPASMQAGQSAPASSLGIMTQLGDGFLRLDVALRERADGTEGARVAGELRGLLPGLDGVRSERGLLRPADLRLARESLSAVLTEIEVLAGQERITGALQAFEGLRSSCVSCHSLHRGPSPSAGMFPNAGNLVTGKIRLVDADGEPAPDLAQVLVFLENKAGELPYEHLRVNPSIGQAGLNFTPSVLPIVRGTSVDFENDDDVFHNVFSLSKPTSFDLGAYPTGESRAVTFTKPGVVRIYCNIHPQMASTIVVLGNSHFALTDEEGRFVISSVPDGEYSLRTWSALGALSEQDLELSAGAAVRRDLELAETRRPAPHPNKYGKRYSSKY